MSSSTARARMVARIAGKEAPKGKPDPSKFVPKSVPNLGPAYDREARIDRAVERAFRKVYRDDTGGGDDYSSGASTGTAQAARERMVARIRERSAFHEHLH